ncbi:glycosyltransferase [Patescibacteria group bacterium]|nr:glycosyltransferase [Patescibacteria group bacterium]
MNLPKISIVTPSFNQAKFIERTIISVLAQNYPNLEYIVVDGGSTDGTLAILEKYKDKIKYVSEKDNGQSDALNKGFAMATGDILGWLNSDDCYLPGSLHKVAKLFQKHPESQWLIGFCKIINQQDVEVSRAITRYKNLLLKFLAGPATLHVANFISQPATFFTPKILQKVGGLDLNLHYAMDYDLWFRLYREVSPAVITDYLAAFRVHMSSKGTTAFNAQFRELNAVSARYTNNRMLLALGIWHNYLVQKIYMHTKPSN